MKEISKNERLKIPFHIHPMDFEKGNHAVEKTDEEGRKRRYLKGITSGMKLDGHGERITGKCIQKMQDQAKSGNILLYEGQHGFTYTEDIGKLVDSEITPTGEWITTYRLYDEHDGFDPGSKTMEQSDKLWKQVNGLPPYVDKETGKASPIQKGFSIEGYIPDDGIIEMTDEGQRTIDDIDLDGVLVTPRPSYKDSVATAVYKALDELQPEKKLAISENIRGRFMSKLEEEKKKENYYTRRYQLEDLLNDSIEEIMSRGVQVNDRLNLLFDEYKETMIQLLVDHASVFLTAGRQSIVDNDGSVEVAKMQQINLLKDIQAKLTGFVNVKLRNAVMKSNKRK